MSERTTTQSIKMRVINMNLEYWKKWKRKELSWEKVYIYIYIYTTEIKAVPFLSQFVQAPTIVNIKMLEVFCFKILSPTI